MDDLIGIKGCQAYEVTDFQHNFEIDRVLTSDMQQWGLHIHSTHYEVLVFIQGNVDFWVEGRRKKLEYGDIVIVNPQEIHRIYRQDDSAYERIVIHMSDSMLKDMSTAQTNLLSVFHKNKAHILQFSGEEMEDFMSNYQKVRGLWKKKEYGADILGSAWLQILLVQISQKMRQAEEEGGEVEVATGLVGKALEYINTHMTKDISVQDIAD